MLPEPQPGSNTTAPTTAPMIALVRMSVRQGDSDAAAERRVMKFRLDRLVALGQVEQQDRMHAVARVDVVEERPAAVGVRLDIGGRIGVELPALGIEHELRAVIQGLALRADVGHLDMQDRELTLRGLAKAQRNRPDRLAVADPGDHELELAITHRAADAGALGGSARSS